MKEPQLQAHGLSLTFNDGGRPFVVFEKISFEIQEGEFVAIVGPSGSGKTSLIRVLCGIIAPSEGDVRISSEVGSISYVPQEPSLLPWRTLVQNAALGVELRRRVTRDELSGIAALIDEFRLRGAEHRYADDLSGGERQRTAVIAALAAGPELLFCDEPFSAVDFVTRLYLNERFRHRCKVHGITTILVTHNIEEAIYLADRIFLLKGRPGRIVATYNASRLPGTDDPVSVRNNEDFKVLFKTIWAALKSG